MVSEPLLRSRRSFLSAAAGGIAAAVAGTLARANPVRANDEAVLTGHAYTATAETRIRATNEATAIRGESAQGDGLAGESGGDFKSGLYGVTNATGGFGVFGRHGPSTSVGFLGGDQTGVKGESAAGIGVFGYSSGGAAVTGSSPGGIALHSIGRIVFEEVSGVVSIPAGSTSVTRQPGVQMLATTFMLLTPRSNLEGRSLWYTTNIGAGTFTIRMSGPRSTATKIAWLLVG